jgi:hypothetical protein
MYFPHAFWNQNGYYAESTSIDETGLILYYKLNSYTSPQVFPDSTVNQRDIQIINPSPSFGAWSVSSGILSSGVFIQTVNSNVNSNPASDPYLQTVTSGVPGIQSGQSLTIGLWTYYSGTLPFNSIRLTLAGNRSYSLGTVGPNYPAVGGNTDRVFFGLKTAGQNVLLLPTLNVTGEKLVTNQWNFLVGWFDTGNATVSIQLNNGTIYSNSVAGGSIITGSDYFNIRKIEASEILFDGLNCIIDEVSLWQRTLTTKERTFLYNNGKGKTYPLANS